MAADLSSLQYVQDEQGDALLVSKEGWQVMMAWEKPYMEACVAALRLSPQCDVLEIGFGLGYSSNAIQRCGVRSHTIIECSPEVLKHLHAWQADDGRGKPRASVHIVEGLWQLRLPELGTFDAVFMDDYPVGSDTFSEELQRRFPMCVCARVCVCVCGQAGGRREAGERMQERYLGCVVRNASA